MGIKKADLPPCTIGEKRFLTPAEACAYVSIGKDTLDEWCRQGLPRSKLGTTRSSLVRYDKLEIDRFLELQSDRLDEDKRENLLKRRRDESDTTANERQASGKDRRNRKQNEHLAKRSGSNVDGNRIEIL